MNSQTKQIFKWVDSSALLYIERNQNNMEKLALFQLITFKTDDKFHGVTSEIEFVRQKEVFLAKYFVH